MRKCENCRYFIPSNEMNKEQQRIFRIQYKYYETTREMTEFGLCSRFFPELVHKDYLCEEWKKR